MVPIRTRMCTHTNIEHTDTTNTLGQTCYTRLCDKLCLLSRFDPIWQSHFAWHGFRYVEVMRYPGSLTPESTCLPFFDH